MSTSLSVRGETCSRISQRSNRKVSSVFEPLVSIFPVHSIFEYYIDRKCLLLISVWMVAMVCKYFRQYEFDILKKIQQYSTLYLYLYRYWPNDLFFFLSPSLDLSSEWPCFFACSVNVNGAEDEYYYPNCPVWERRKMFMKDQPRGDKTRDIIEARCTLNVEFSQTYFIFRHILI